MLKIQAHSQKTVSHYSRRFPLSHLGPRSVNQRIALKRRRGDLSIILALHKEVRKWRSRGEKCSCHAVITHVTPWEYIYFPWFPLRCSFYAQFNIFLKKGICILVMRMYYAHFYASGYNLLNSWFPLWHTAFVFYYKLFSAPLNYSEKYPMGLWTKS